MNKRIELVSDQVVRVLPLVDPPSEEPKTRVRGYTPEEAVKHLRREFVMDRNRFAVVSISESGIYTNNSHPTVRFISYDRLARDAKWCDDNSPCGVVEQLT